MSYQKRLDIDKFGLRDLVRFTFAISLVLAVGIYTNWVLALMGMGIPLLALGILSIGIRAGTEASSQWLVTCGAVLLSFWFVLLAIPAFLWAIYYAAFHFAWLGN